MGLGCGNDREACGWRAKDSAINGLDLTGEGGRRVGDEVSIRAFDADVLKVVDMPIDIEADIMAFEDGSDERLHVIAFRPVFRCLGIHRVVADDDDPDLMRIGESLIEPFELLLIILRRGIGISLPIGTILGNERSGVNKHNADRDAV